MKKKPLVCFLISCYNSEKYIEQSLMSVINQTYDNMEIMISDDGSDDKTQDIIYSVIEKHSERKYTLFFEKNNTCFGVLEKMQSRIYGDYFMWIDADDSVDKNIVEKYVDFMEQNKEYSLCSSVPVIINERKTVDSKEFLKGFIFKNGTSSDMFMRLITEGNHICAPSVFYRTELVSKYELFRYKFRQMHDYDLWLRILKKERLYIMDSSEIQFYYRIHDNNMSIQNEETDSRLRTEYALILLEIMNTIEIDFFIESFGKLFIYNPDDSRCDYECEKLILLLSLSDYAAVNYYYYNIDDPDFKRHLENDYHFTREKWYYLTQKCFSCTGIVNFDKFEKLYIYGAGFYGNKLMTLFNDKKIDVDGYIISNEMTKPENQNGYPVYYPDEIDTNAETGIIIAIGNGLERIKIRKKLFQSGIYNIDCYY